MIPSLWLYPYGSFSNIPYCINYPWIRILVSTWHSICNHFSDSRLCDDDRAAADADILRRLLPLWDRRRVNLERLNLCDDLFQEACKLQARAWPVRVFKCTRGPPAAVAPVHSRFVAEQPVSGADDQKGRRLDWQADPPAVRTQKADDAIRWV